MPVDLMVVVMMTAGFVVFAVTLYWADHRTRRTRSGY
jgi:hypothetical protein